MEFEIKGGRTVECHLCSKTIENGEDRVVANLGSGLYAKRYHLKCFIKKFSKTLTKLNDVIEQMIREGEL